MALRFLLWIIFYTSVLSAVKLPGACPKVPPTHSYYDWDILGSQTFLGISFSAENPSHLFKEMNHSTSFGFNIGLRVKGYLEKKLRITVTYSSNPHQGTFEGYGVLDSSNQSISLDTLVYEINIINSKDYPMKCITPIKENIRVWVDGDFVIIYSCINSTKTNHHDEAVILLVSQPKDIDYFVERYYYVYPEKVEEMLKDLKMVAKKYLSGALLAMLEWPRNISFEYLTYNPYECPAFVIPWFLVSIIFCFILLAVVLAYDLLN